MARQRRLLQIARRMLPLTGKASSSPTDWEKKREQANKLLQRKHGIPNALQLGHTLAVQSPFGGKDRVCTGGQIAWPGLPALSPVGVCRGGIIEVCSPGQICRDVAAQMALMEARAGSVLWMAAGPQEFSFGSSGLREVPNLTLQQRPICIPEDSRAVLQELIRLVRQQTYTMVVLDHVAGLAPPLPLAFAPQPPVSTWVTAPHLTFPTPLAQGQAAAAANAGPEAAAGRMNGGVAAAAAGVDLVGKCGTAAAAGAAAAVAAKAAAAQGRQQQHGNLAAWGPEENSFPPWNHQHDQHHYHHHHNPQQAGPPLSLPLPLPPPDCGFSSTPNLKFLLNVLPLLLDETLAELAASCGPELRTTTLILNSYPWRERERAGLLSAAGLGAGGGSGSGGRSRWARRAILRHASATLHVTPEVNEAAAVTGAGVVAAPGAGVVPVRCLRAVLSRASSAGEDGGPLRTWSLNTPVRLAPWSLPHQPSLGGGT